MQASISLHIDLSSYKAPVNEWVSVGPLYNWCTTRRLLPTVCRCNVRCYKCSNLKWCRWGLRAWHLNNGSMLPLLSGVRWKSADTVSSVYCAAARLSVDDWHPAEILTMIQSHVDQVHCSIFKYLHYNLLEYIIHLCNGKLHCTSAVQLTF